MRYRFRPADSAQQIVGGFLLAGPFVVTEEVWDLAENMNRFRMLLTVIVACAIGYGALYQADTKRDPDRETAVVGVPVRFLSLMCVAFGSVAILAFLFDAPDTFLDSSKSTAELVETTFNAVSVGAVFSVVGAATADTLF
ncbi:DUF2391 family protein [Natrialba asiatica]|uniref:Integral membrane protein n=1 Tax=Natrialba asiatica (strain ATCC 700177 / DSM 12278 / JCM 9576 / FERM P-10747 / NBRC 102637 / 172P1) TaxID=29540 RepID=M0AJT5_NATA1|nr:DUF2391 family protein [Natrialba asiatica]ELY98162.1 hypothetical protein C481_19550 [Natrialba asiatica DSM 12278]